ncbi:MAG TPA: glycerophosphodiester phosphodiesterase family protein [Elusimicrobiota bacterium]|nr:glycerophosphodiester phosphodiesterase family protein [Elusimicrobiota bacterium]
MLMIAHRGYSGKAPENTMAAFKMALAAGAKALELDVHQTKDGRLAVIHDGDLKRLAGMRRKIARMTWRELGAADVGAWFSPRFSGERVPLLEEVLDFVRGRAQVHVELKAGSGAYPGIEERLAEILEKRGAWAWAAVSSFDHRALRRLREICPQARLGYLLGPTRLSRAWKETALLGAESLNVSARQATARRVREGHKRRLKIFVYTVNDSKTLARMKRLGADGVYTNFPEMTAP